MDDFDDILHYVDAAGDGESILYNETGNPFLTETNKNQNESKNDFNRRVARAREELKKQNLLSRTYRIQPRVPACVTRGTSCTQSRANSQMSTARDPCLSQTQTTASRRKWVNVNDLITTKRQIYKTQYLIDKKKREMKRLDYNQQKVEYLTAKEENHLSEETDEYKKTMNSLQASLSNARKRAAEASHKLACKNREYLTTASNLAAARSVILKSEETYEQYREYKNFLQSFLVPGANALEYFKDPVTLINEIDLMQNDTLALVNCCTHFMEVENVFLSKDSKSIEKIEKQTDNYQKLTNEVIDETKELDSQFPRKKSSVDKIDDELAKLKNLVQECYEECYGTKSTLTTINMLEKIELSLEQMVVAETKVAPEVLSKIKSEREEARRLKERLDGHEKRRQEQLKKVEITMARSLKPVVHRDNRPMKERILPPKTLKRVSVDEEAILKEKQREEQLLYGED